MVDLIVEGFAEDDGVAGAILGSGSRTTVRSKPEVNAIKKMKTRRVNQRIRIGMVLRAEEDGCCEDSLETLDNSPIMATVGSEAEEIEHLKSSVKVEVRLFCWTARVATQMGINRSWPKGKPNSGCAAICRKNFPFLRVWVS